MCGFLTDTLYFPVFCSCKKCQMWRFKFVQNVTMGSVCSVYFYKIYRQNPLRKEFMRCTNSKICERIDKIVK